MRRPLHDRWVDPLPPLTLPPSHPSHSPPFPCTIETRGSSATGSCGRRGGTSWTYDAWYTHKDTMT